ncbi:MAG: glycosyltransferase [Elusimicrobiota bacterium]|nr:glycosyltransferase [Elusimicrobiota bacterium]
MTNEIKLNNIYPLFDLDPIAGFCILYVLLKNKIDIIDIHSPKFYWLCVFLGRLLSKRVFITRNVEYRKKGIKKFINRYLYKMCNGVICISQKIKNGLIEDFKLPEKKVKVIYGNLKISDQVMPKDIRISYGISKNTILLSIIGRIERNKGQDFAVKVLYELFKKGYDCKLFIVGANEDKKFYSELTKMIEDMNLSNKIIFTGFVENVMDYIYSSDVILCCSLFEGIPRSVIESLLIGIPVVSTPAVRMEEIPLDSKYLSLLFIVDRDVQKFVEKIQYVIETRLTKDKILNNYNFGISKLSDGVNEYLDFYTSV